MQTSSLVARERAIELARSWKGTPYVMRGRVKGAGVDCGTLLLEYLIEIGAAEREDIPLYAGDWFCHTTDERYMRHLLKYARKIVEGICCGTPDAAPGNLILFKSHHNADLFIHGAIVLNWPRVLHAEYCGVHESTATSHTLMAFKPFAIFDPWSNGSNA